MDDEKKGDTVPGLVGNCTDHGARDVEEFPEGGLRAWSTIAGAYVPSPLHLSPAKLNPT